MENAHPTSRKQQKQHKQNCSQTTQPPYTDPFIRCCIPLPRSSPARNAPSLPVSSPNGSPPAFLTTLARGMPPAFPSPLDPFPLPLSPARRWGARLPCNRGLPHTAQRHTALERVPQRRLWRAAVLLHGLHCPSQCVWRPTTNGRAATHAHTREEQGNFEVRDRRFPCRLTYSTLLKNAGGGDAEVSNGHALWRLTLFLVLHFARTRPPSLAHMGMPWGGCTPFAFFLFFFLRILPSLY